MQFFLLFGKNQSVGCYIEQFFIFLPGAFHFIRDSQYFLFLHLLLFVFFCNSYLYQSFSIGMSQTPPDESHYHQYTIPKDIEMQINEITNLQALLNQKILNLQEQLQNFNQLQNQPQVLPSYIQHAQQSVPSNPLQQQLQQLPQPQQLPSPPHHQYQEKIKLPPITELPLYKEHPITPPQLYKQPQLLPLLQQPPKKKRKQTTINFMISTPSNPPVKKYNK